MKKMAIFTSVVVLSSSLFAEWYNDKQIWENNTNKTFYDTGQLKNETFHQKGTQHTLTKQYNQNGSISYEAYDDNGDGFFRYYDSKSGIILEDTIKQKKQNGVSREYSKDKILLRELVYINGIQDGIEKKYYDSGELHHESNFKNGEKEGIEKTYDRKSGNLVAEIFYNKGKAVSGTSYSVDGTKKTEMTNAHFHKYNIPY